MSELFEAEAAVRMPCSRGAAMAGRQERLSLPKGLSPDNESAFAFAFTPPCSNDVCFSTLLDGENQMCYRTGGLIIQA